MPLLNIVGVTGMNPTSHIGQAFLSGETKGDYDWALTQLLNLQREHNIPAPQVFLVDRDLAFLNALELIFVRIPVLLCLWHIMKDVQAHARRRSFPREVDATTGHLQDSFAHKEFCNAFLRVVYATTEEDYNFRRQ
ncbi:hypothetical protein ON010_g7359 [Phytophthora cinnamomi]|nr:hypothetical protein ON010_g7359 [Phytophthora cinnamomi]